MAQWMDVTIQSTEDTPTYRDLMARVWYNADGGVNDSSNECIVEGDFSEFTHEHKPIYLPYGGGGVKLHEFTKRVYKTYGASQNIYIGGSVSGVNTQGGGLVYDTANYTVPAREYTKPTAPGQPSVSGITEDEVTIEWGDPSNWGGDNTSDFDLQVDNNSNFASPVFNGEVNNANTRVVTGLAPNTTYYIRVRGRNTAGDGTWSATRSFKTLAAYPTAPQNLMKTASGATLFTASWEQPLDWGGDDTDSYDVQIATASNFAGATTYSVGNIYRTFNDLTPGETYYVRVAGKNARGRGTWSTTLTVLLISAPSVPQNVVIGSTTALSVELTWDAPADTGGSEVLDYRVRISTDPGMASPTSVAVVDESYTFTGLEPNTDYYLDVQARNAAGYGDLSATIPSSTLASLYVKKGSVWKAVTQVFVKKGGVWKEVTDVFVKKGGVWKS